MSVEPVTLSSPPSVHYYGSEKRAKHSKKHLRPGEWEEVYFENLRKGYVKASAAALAGVHPNTPNTRRLTDKDFEEQEAIAYNIGTTRFENRAHERIEDKENPSDSVLKHVLSHRGITSTQKIEMSGGVDVNVTHNLFPIDKLPLGLRVWMLACLDGVEMPAEVEHYLLSTAPAMEMKRITASSTGDGNGKGNGKEG